MTIYIPPRFVCINKGLIIGCLESESTTKNQSPEAQTDI